MSTSGNTLLSQGQEDKDNQNPHNEARKFLYQHRDIIGLELLHKSSNETIKILEKLSELLDWLNKKDPHENLQYFHICTILNKVLITCRGFVSIALESLTILSEKAYYHLNFHAKNWEDYQAKLKENEYLSKEILLLKQQIEQQQKLVQILEQDLLWLRNLDDTWVSIFLLYEERRKNA